MLKQLSEFRETIKEQICGCVVDLYKSQNEGNLPNWEQGEEIVVDDSKLTPFYINIDVFEPHSNDNFIVEKQVINKYVVTLDYNLYFHCGDYNNEIHWDEISTDELVGIYINIKKA